jgi:hypothetical protein
MARDFTQEELAVIEMLERKVPIDYGKRILEIDYESGKRVYTRIKVEEGIAEKHRPGNRGGTH